MFSSSRIRRMANSCVESDAEEIWRFSAPAFCFILLCFIWKPWSLNLVFMFGKNPSAMDVHKLCSLPTVCLEVLSFSHAFSLFLAPSLSLSLSTFVRENPGVWLQACGLSPPYFICIMRHHWLNCKCMPWLVLLQFVINVCFFFPWFSHFLSVFLAFSGGCRLDESDFMPVSKPKVFYL